MDRWPDPSEGALPLDFPARTGVCPAHGEFSSRRLMATPRGGIWSQCPACAQARHDAERVEEAQRQRARKEAAHQKMLAAARIPARFIGRSFDNFEVATADQRHALTVVRDFTEGFAEHARRGSGLVLAGLPGTGKSHLATAALQALLDRDVCYLSCMDLIRSVRDTWRRDAARTEAQVLGYLERLDLLVIDEVGVQYGTEGEQTVLFDVLDRRYREMKSTLLLTNQDKAGFKAFVGDRSFDRLVETTRWVAFDWPSHRPAARRAAMAAAIEESEGNDGGGRA